MMKEVRLIDANALKQVLQSHHDFFVRAWGSFHSLPANDKARVDEITNCIAEIVNAPSIDAEPVIHARWEWYEEPVTSLCPDPDYGWRCSHCKEDAERMIERAYPHSNVEFVDDDKPPKIDYCPNCGAKMDGGADNATNA